MNQLARKKPTRIMLYVSPGYEFYYKNVFNDVLRIQAYKRTNQQKNIDKFSYPIVVET